MDACACRSALERFFSFHLYPFRFEQRRSFELVNSVFSFSSFVGLFVKGGREIGRDYLKRRKQAGEMLKLLGGGVVEEALDGLVFIHVYGSIGKLEQVAL